MLTLGERFWSKVRKSEGCWLWLACTDKWGYGLFQASGKTQKAHRISWELHRGAIPKNQAVLHRCDRPSCVRPEHLFLGTQIDNLRDMDSKGRRRAPKGEKHYAAKLTVEQVRQIPELREQGLSQYAIARRFGVSRSSILQILRGASWKSVVTVTGTGPDARNKLTEEQRAEIRGLLSSGLRQREIAARFGISRPTVSRLAAGRGEHVRHDGTGASRSSLFELSSR